jgi:predicted 2-oxoglutarate/Fe(II)-dependent dioxygenase YbiX
MHADRYANLFSDDPDLDCHRYVLQDQYLELTRVKLPAVAKAAGWTITEDHCFMRIILDQLFDDCWYNHLDKRLVAYKQLSEDQLKVAIELAHSILDRGEVLLEIWNRQSLAWRNKN